MLRLQRAPRHLLACLSTTRHVLFSSTAAPASAPSASPPAALIKALRESTGAPMLDCRNALAASNNKVPAAEDWLRKKGMAAATKKAGRSASQGLIAAALAEDGRSGSLVEVRALPRPGLRLRPLPPHPHALPTPRTHRS